MSLFHNLKRIFSFFWCALDGVRRLFLNLLFFILLIAIALVIFGGNKKLNEKTVLVLDLRGNLVEQETSSARRLLILEAQGERKYYTQLRDVINVLDQAAKDPKISSVLLLTDDMHDAGLASLREIASSLEAFKKSNKKVVAWGSKFNQKQYLLASHANEVYLHPMGMVMLEGFGGYKNYYRDALDKLGVTVNVMRAGNFKSFVEPFVANGPSKDALEAAAFLYNDLWATYTKDVEASRKLETGSIMRSIDNLPDQVKQLNGNLAKLALNGKFVDGLKTRDELRQHMLQYSVEDEEIKSFRQVHYEDYLAREAKLNMGGQGIGVVIAEGEISDGIAPPGAIGGLSTANLIRQARDDEQVKAVVLRINSPGGSAFGSELIRREVEITREAGKPVVVSMGNVAASGGYWMSMGADEVIADAATVTGSIGVFALLPTLDKTMEKIGVHTGGTTTAWLKGGYDPTRPIDPRFAELVQQGVNYIYAEFINKAAVARNLPVEKIDEAAQGRVWSGQQAKERGLVDNLGGYTDAIKSAAGKANLGGDYAIYYIEAEPSGIDKFLKLFDMSVGTMSFEKLIEQLAAQFVSQTYAQLFPANVSAIAPEMAHDMRWLADIAERNRTFGVVTHCMCEAP